MVDTARAPGTPAAARRARWPEAVAAVLLVVHATLVIDTARRESVTVDEVGHLPAGIAYLRTGSFEIYHHNPPLVKLLAALAAETQRPVVDFSKSWESNRRSGRPLSPWAFGWEFMYANAADYHRIYSVARLPTAALSIVAGVVIFLWARELFGPSGGLVALALWAFCPNVIAHAGLVTSDIGGAALGFVATYAFWRWLRRPGWPAALATGVLLGFAELAKFSMLVLYVLWPLLWLVRLLTEARLLSLQPGRRGASPTAGHLTSAESSADTPPSPPCQGGDKEGYRPRGIGVSTRSGSKNGASHGAAIGACARSVPVARQLFQLLTTVLVSIAVINLGYAFEGTGERLGRFPFLSRALTRPRQPGTPLPPGADRHPLRQVYLERQNRFFNTWLASLPMPLPRHYLEGFDEQKLESEGGYPVYLCGEIRRSGWWWYYLVALALKVPLGTWLVSLAAFLPRRAGPAPRAGWADAGMVLVPPLLFLAVMSFGTNINLGVRYVLPAFPFWFVWVGRVGAWFDASKPSGAVHNRWARPVALALALTGLVWNAGECLAFHPHELAYFNELAGGPDKGRRYLIDSNLDWGQDLRRLEEWMRDHRPGQRVGLAYFGNVDPSILARQGRPLFWQLAPPLRLGMMHLVGTQEEGRFAALRREWMTAHENEIVAWLRSELPRRPDLTVNDYPALRARISDELELSEGPRPGLFAVSVNLLQGLPFRVRDQAGNLWAADEQAFGFFRLLTPVAKAGYSILIYDVTADEANRVRDELGLPRLSGAR